MKNKIGSQIKLSNVRLNYFRDSIWVPDKMDEKDSDDKLRYQCDLLIDPGTNEGRANLSLVRETICEVIEETWKKDPPRDLPVCLTEGSNKNLTKYPAYKDLMYVRATSKNKPRIIDNVKMGGEFVDVPREDRRFYPGVRVNASIRIWPLNMKQFKKRVVAEIMAIQFHADDTAIFDSVPNMDLFEEMATDEKMAAFL